MGKKLNALIGRSSKTARKLSMLINLAISRITIIKNLHSIKCSQAETDVIELLQLGYQERALIRVEQVIKEQNALDAYVLIENYCRLLVGSAEMIKSKRECPDELKETVSTLIFAASRCGEFPELQEIRFLFTSVFGNEFVKCSVELKNNCHVYPKMIQRFSTQQPSLKTRQNLLEQIAKHNGITIQLDHEASDSSSKVQTSQEKCEEEHFLMIVSNESAAFGTQKTIPAEEHFRGAKSKEISLSEELENEMANYCELEDAAQYEFESAENAAVELSGYESFDDDNQSGSHNQLMEYKSSETLQTEEDETSEEIHFSKLELRFNLS